MATLKTSYQRIREELVSLSVELEERSKVCELLRKRLDEERYSVRNGVEDTKKEVESQMRDMVLAHKESIDSLMKDSSELMGRKKELMARCQDLVTEVADLEAELGSAINAIRDEGQLALDKDKKLFRIGYEDRKSKALSDKMTEVKADTRRAMEPEFQRLRRAHDGEMESLLTRLSEDDKSLRDAYEKLLRERMSDEERAWKTSSQIRAREALDTASMELEALEAGHKESIKKTSRQLRTEIDAHKAAVTAQLEDEKVRLKASLRRIKEEQESQLGDLRDAHRQGVEQLHGDHEEAVRRLRLRDQAARAAADRQHETDMSSVAAARAGRGSSSVQAESASSVAARDSRVQEEIRRLQTETIKLERAMKTKIDHEKKAVAETAEREIDASERSFSRLQSETSELIVQKEALLAAIHRTSTEMSVLQEQRMDAESELNMLENGIRQAENESARRQEQQVRERREELDAITSAVERSHQKFIAVQKLCMEQERAQQEELKGMERDFERALEDMDHNVKRDVEKCDREIEIIRDAVHTEKIKQEKLRKIVKSYGVS